MDPDTPNAPASSGIDTFENTANKLLTEHGHGEVQISPTTTKIKGDAEAETPRKLIWVNPYRMARRSQAFQTFTAAHETAHHVLRHGHSRLVTAIMLIASCMLSIVAIGAGILALLKGSALFGLWAIPLVLFALVVLGVVLSVLVKLMITRIPRREEREADAQAAVWGYPMTIAIADELANTDQNPRLYQRIPQLSTHDPPHDRVNE